MRPPSTAAIRCATWMHGTRHSVSSQALRCTCHPISASGSGKRKSTIPARAGSSAQDVVDRRHEHTGAAGLAPHATVGGAGLAAVVVAGSQQAILDPELALEQ